MTEQWESPRARAEREKRERRELFDSVMDQVDAGDLDMDTAIALVGLGGQLDERPAHSLQGMQIRRLERSIDEAGDA